MANKHIFRSLAGSPPKADSVNEAGGKAFALPPRQALAQYAVTGCLNGTFYASAETQLQRVLEMVSAAGPEFTAKVALYSREGGHMKDMPALLCAALSVLDANQLKAVFPKASWNDLHLQIIYFGREHCPARGHDLTTCPICSWAASPVRIRQEMGDKRGVKVDAPGPTP